MRARFEFDAAAWSIPEVRHVVETLASLMEATPRLAPPGSDTEPGEAVVFVGIPGAAPPDAAAVIAVEGWPRWEGRSLTLARLGGEPLPCPPGTPSTGPEERVLPPAWLRSAGFMLAREEEAQDDRRDQWSCYSGVFSRQNDLGILDRACVNRMARALDQRLAAHATERGAMMERRPLWPNGAPFAAVLSHDVDDVTYTSFRGAWRLLRQAGGPGTYALRAGLTGLARAAIRRPGAPDPYEVFDRWMTEEERHGFRASWYFCTPESARRHPYDPLYTSSDRIRFEGRRISVGDLMRTMLDRGHEVGLHGGYLSFTDAEELSRQRAHIARVSGAEPAGVRQHFLRFHVGSTWRAQRQAGFEYDTTLGYNESVGFRAGVGAPFRPWDAEKRSPVDVWELPLTLMDGTLFRILKLDASGAAHRVRMHLDEVQQVGGLAVLLWHPNSADERLFPGWWECFSATLDELERRNAWVTTAVDALKWWRTRQVSSPSGSGLC